ncbi:pancreatic lipase-related protein 2-like [Stegodyphus dumicola]|uniref:pancreatic lipase-related protein 2-like n=1 Tax=Stegodyphus dumicola TaxID=202533 RepID=UPI0015A9E355|nr:pancreatic lipase-related protein 2-like [Stegodyphus dumicola]
MRYLAGTFVFIAIFAYVSTLCIKNDTNNICHHLRKRSLIFVEKIACYPDLGCFSSGPPFYHPIYRPLSVPPEPPEVIRTMFLLFTRRNKNRPIFLSPRHQKSVKKSTFNPDSLTRIIVHGLNDNLAINTWVYRMRDVILDRADENVVIVDWSGSNRIPYTIAVANSRVVGAQIAQFIKFLYKTLGTSPESFHVIGHSLGAHIAGYAGERLHKLGRITGLDPAGPFFRNVPDKVRLDPSDAVFVDVIHSDPGVSVFQGFGTHEDDGDLDFYPGGGDPPGCEKTIIRSFKEDIPTEALGNLIACQHFRAFDFFIYSFNQNGCLFVGVECPSWAEFLKGQCDCGPHGEKCAIMGIFAPTYTFLDGKHYSDRRFYLKVGPERPFCVHQYQITIYLQTLNYLKSYGFEAAQAEITVTGKLGKLKGKLYLGIHLTETNQVKKFLMSSSHPVGEILSAIVVISQTPVLHTEGHFSKGHYESVTDTVVDKVKINYLFPLPKEYTTSVLCRTSEHPHNSAGRKFELSAEFCY